VRVAQDDLRPHVYKFINKEQPAFEHFLMDNDLPFGLGGHHQDDTEQVGGESGPGRIGNREDRTIYIVLNLITVFMLRDKYIVTTSFKL